MALLYQLYADSMKDHSFGYAFYKPVSNKILKPGSVGVFSGNGTWNPITNLSDAKALQDAGLSPPTSLTKAPVELIKGWGPKVSSQVNSYTGSFNGAASGLASGLPVQAGLQLKFTTTSDFGAVLITSPPITHESYYFESPFQQWMKANAKALLAGPYGVDIANHGLFIVTQTFATANGSLTAWSNPENEVYLGFDISAPGAGQLGPHGGWYKGKSMTGWNDFEAEGDELKVVFASGLWYKKRVGSKTRLSETKEHQDRSSQDAATDIPVGLEDGEEVFLELEHFGKPPEPREDDEEPDDIDI